MQARGSAQSIPGMRASFLRASRGHAAVDVHVYTIGQAGSGMAGTVASRFTLRYQALLPV